MNTVKRQKSDKIVKIPIFAEMFDKVIPFTLLKFLNIEFFEPISFD